MGASAKNEQSVNVIMGNFQELKCEYAQLQQNYKDLEVLCKRQKERLADGEKSKNQLIKLLKEKVEKVSSFKANIESLRIENSNLSSSIQDQNLLIGEHLTTIEKLKKENALLKSKKSEPKNVIERGIKQSGPVKPHNGINGNNFSHPSFDAPTTEVSKKKKKKSPLNWQNRYSNLDISGSGIRRNEESSEASSEENRQTANGKKRRLFSLEDEMIDLTIENKE